MKDFKITDIRNPKNPRSNIPIADIFVICSNSFLEGFFSVSHTLLHLIKNELNLLIINLDGGGF